MSHYIGIDIACKSSVICAIDEEGNQVFTKQVKTDAIDIVKCLNQNHIQVLAIGIESGTECHHLARSLEDFGYIVEIIDARKAATIIESLNTNKTDPNDALAIATLLRINVFSKVNKKSSDQLDRIALLNARKMLVDQRVAIGNQVRGLAKVNGIKIAGKFNPTVWKTVIAEHPMASDSFRKTMEIQLSVYEQLEKGICKYDEMLENIVKEDQEVQILMTAPGVGPLVAVAFKAHIGEISFGRSRDVGSFLGMTPREFSSGESIRRGGISKRGPAYLRQLMMNAGMSIICHSKKDCSLKRWADRKCLTMPQRAAYVAAGRKLAIALYRMLQTKTKFHFDLLEESAA